MNKQHYSLLKDLSDGGSVRVDNVVESKILLDELIEAGLVEVIRCEGTVTGGLTCAEYQLTQEGRSLAESLQSEHTY